MRIRVIAALALLLILPAPCYPDCVPAPIHYPHNWRQTWRETSRGEPIDEVAELAVAYFPNVQVDGLPLPVIMTAIGEAESAGQPDRIGDRNTPVESVGLWQVRLVHVAYLERVTGSTDRAVWVQWLENPQNNARSARAVYEGADGLDSWGSYTSGRWRLFLKPAQKSVEEVEW